MGIRTKPLPDRAYLHQRLHYDPVTGKLYWREHLPHGPRWNGRYAGREAFTANDGHGYKQGHIDGVRYTAHRVVWAMHNGDWPGEIDHEDHDRTNNRVGNLRAATRVANKQNLTMRADNSSGVTGVCWDRDRGKWRAQIKTPERRVHLGLFDTLDAAAAARKAAEREHGFHLNHGE